MNGKIVPWDQATVHVSAHALHYGTAFFDSMRCYETDKGPIIFRPKDHVARLYASAAAYGAKIPFDPLEVESACAEVVRRNHFNSCYIRPLCYFGSATLGVHPRVPKIELVILAFPWDPFLKKQGEESGIRVTISPWRRFHYDMMPTTSKASGGYLNSVLAVMDAVKRGFTEAILLNQEGNVAEGSGENVFIVKNNKLITNDEHSSILLGITRDTVIQLAHKFGLEISVQAISKEALFSADEAFFTGTAAEIVPIREIDEKVIGSGSPGPITQRLQQTYTDIIHGRLPEYREWLYPVGTSATPSTRH